MKILFIACLFVWMVGCVTIPETGRSAFIVTSESQEAQLGAQAYGQILAKEKISNNRRWTQILNRVGQRISRAANKPEFQWEFKLIESNQKNAFCLPGGKVAFYTGIFPVAKNEAGIAAVMGHEVAHATARHGGQRMTLALGTNIGMMGLSLALGTQSKERNLILAALGVGTTVGAVLPFSRTNESEADEIGLIYMARAGYDPKEASRFWGRMAKGSGAGPPEFLSTHPSSNRRMNALRAQVPKVMSLYQRSPKYGLGENL